MNSLRQGSLDLRQQRLDRIDNIDDVGPRLALNIQHDCRIGVHPGRQLRVLDAVDNGSHVGEAHRSATAISNDDRAVLNARYETVVVINSPSLVRSVEIALGLVDVRAGERRSQRLETKAVGRQRRRIRTHAHSRALSSADAD